MEKTTTKEGSIKYKITEEKDGSFNVVFEDSAEKSLVVFCAAEYLSKSIAEAMEIEKKKAKTTRDKRRLEALRTKSMAVSFGSKMIIDFIQPFYKEFVEKEKKKEQSKSNEKN